MSNNIQFTKACGLVFTISELVSARNSVILLLNGELLEKYQQKVTARIKSLSMPEKDRYSEMVKTQPWILGLVTPKDIAAYLFITPQKLRECMK